LNTRQLTPVRYVLPVILLAFAAAAHGQQPATESREQQKEHVVRRGDTLWDLARAYLQNPFLWPAIYEANRDVVENPHWIYPAERLIIPPHLKQPLAAADEVPAVLTGTTWAAADQDLRVVPVSADAMAADTPATVLRTLDLRRTAVTAHEYLSAPWLSAAPLTGVTGRIASKTDPAAASERMMPTLMPQERVNIVVTAGGAPGVGDSLLVVRIGGRVAQAGSVVEPVAVLRVEQAAGGVVTGRVIAQFSDARVGDLVMQVPPAPAMPVGTPVAATQTVGGQLLRFVDRGGLHGTTDLAFVSVGRAQGIGIGDELSVYVPAGDASPAVQLAVVRVVRADETSSTARVVSVSSTGLREGLPVSLLRKMP
jgi:hypothetical protein